MLNDNTNIHIDYMRLLLSFLVLLMLREPNLFILAYQVVLKFYDGLDHLQSHPSSATKGVGMPTSQKERSKRSVLSRLGQIFSCIFGMRDSGGYDKAIIEKIKKNLHIFQENQNLQDQIQNLH